MRNKLYLSCIVLFMAVVLNACAPSPSPIAPKKTKPVIQYTTTIFDVTVDRMASAARFKDQRPNIIFILTDDQPYYMTDNMPTVKNELIAKGINFQYGFATTPLCCPSRTSILTGQYAHNHQILANGLPNGGATLFKDRPNLGNWMQSAGYYTAYLGKFLNDYNDLTPRGHIIPGWNEWDAFLDKRGFQFFYNYSISENGKIVQYPKSRANFSADILTQKAVNFIRDAEDKPFFLLVAYDNPHSPYLSAPRHADTLRIGSSMEWIPYRPPNFNEPDISDKPTYVHNLVPYTQEKMDATNKQIQRSLLSVDDGVASILNALKKTGLSDNTIIVYMSDNGLTLGEHHFGPDKDCPYEECVRVPFIVYGPKYFSPRLDTTHMVANIDLASTFTELAGAKIPTPVDGMSLLPILKDSSAPWRSDLLLEHWPAVDGVGADIPQFSSVRTTQWKYVEYVTGECELYNLQTDPYELNNIYNFPENAIIIADLKKQLEILKNQ